MQALPPLLPEAAPTYDATNERKFREALTRFFQQQRTDSAVADPQQSASPIAGRLVKAIGGGVLGLTNLTESGTTLTIEDSIVGTRAVSLASTLAVAGATTLGSLSVGGATVLHSTLEVTGDTTIGGTLGVGAGARASVGDLRLLNNASVRFRNGANSGNVYGLGVDSSDRVLIADSGASLTRIGSDLALGPAAAATGAFRLANAASINWRNAGGTADLVGLTVDSSNNIFLGDASNASTQILGGTGGIAFQITSGGGTKWRWLGASPFDMIPWHNFPSNDNLQSLGASATRLKSGFFGTSVVTPVVDSGSGNLTLNRAGVLQLTLAASAATFVGTVQGTRLISTIATGTAPLTVTSTTVVANLHATNSDQLGGTAAASYALLASPAFTGTPAAPTAAPGTNTTQIATTAFVQAATGALVTGVSSVFGRTGAVVAATNDYNFTQLAGSLASSQLSGDYVFPGQVGAIGPFVGIGLTDTSGIGWAVESGTSAYLTTRLKILRAAGVANLQFIRTQGTLTSPTTINSSGLSLGQFGFDAYDGTSNAAVGSIVCVSTQAYTSAAHGCRIDFGTTANGASAITTSWRLDQDGAWKCATDNTFDIGASGATRPRTGYFGTSLVAPFLDSGAASDLLLKRNATTILTLGASAVTNAQDYDTVSGKVYKVNAVQVVSARNTGWTAPTATQSKAGFGNGATSTQIEQTLSAVVNALITHGLLGA